MALALMLGVGGAAADTPPSLVTVDLTTLNEFSSPDENWSIAGALTGDPRREKELYPAAGRGVLVNRPTGAAKGHLFTIWEHGDIELEFDFLVSAKSNSGVYLQGRYEVQICDTWNQPRRPSHDTGSIYQRWDDTRPKGQEGYHGHAPLVEVDRAPGLWQHLSIIFRAPRFDGNGAKVRSARFERVALNGVLVQKNVEVYGPTRVAHFMTEGSTGPLMFQGDHGAVAYRNLKYRRLGPEEASPAGPMRPEATALEANEGLMIEQGTCDLADGRRLKALAVGSPTGLHYLYAADQAVLLKIWRGPFLSEPPGSNYSGDMLRLVPGGSVISLADRPSFVWLEDKATRWPIRTGSDRVDQPVPLQYDDKGQPVFAFTAGPRTGRDQIMARPDRQGLSRIVRVDEAPTFPSPPTGAAWCLLAEADVITPSQTGYIIGDREYYLDLVEAAGWELAIRKSAGRYQLVARAPSQASTLAYDLIW